VGDRGGGAAELGEVFLFEDGFFECDLFFDDAEIFD
jgi:hypothetical protein